MNTKGWKRLLIVWAIVVMLLAVATFVRHVRAENYNKWIPPNMTFDAMDRQNRALNEQRLLQEQNNIQQQMLDEQRRYNSWQRDQIERQKLRKQLQLLEPWD